MKTFKIFKHPTQGYEAVKVGFSWPGLFFGVIWMLVKKLWGFAGIWFGLYVICAIIESVVVGPFGIFILVASYLALWLIPGIKGNKWREGNLSSRGFEYVNTVEAVNPDSAVAQMAKSQAQPSQKDSQSENTPPKPKPFAGFQDIPDQSKKKQGPTLHLPKGKE